MPFWGQGDGQQNGEKKWWRASANGVLIASVDPWISHLWLTLWLDRRRDTVFFLQVCFFPKKNATQKICVCYQVCFFVAFSTGSSTERGQFFQLGGFFLSEVLRFITQNGSSKDVTFTERRVGGWSINPMLKTSTAQGELWRVCKVSGQITAISHDLGPKFW